MTEQSLSNESHVSQDAASYISATSYLLQRKASQSFLILVNLPLEAGPCVILCVTSDALVFHLF